MDNFKTLLFVFYFTLNIEKVEGSGPFRETLVVAHVFWPDLDGGLGTKNKAELPFEIGVLAVFV